MMVAAGSRAKGDKCSPDSKSFKRKEVGGENEQRTLWTRMFVSETD